jgi:hypothetical protein
MTEPRWPRQEQAAIAKNGDPLPDHVRCVVGASAQLRVPMRDVIDLRRTAAILSRLAKRSCSPSGPSSGQRKRSCNRAQSRARNKRRAAIGYTSGSGAIYRIDKSSFCNIPYATTLCCA